MHQHAHSQDPNGLTFGHATPILRVADFDRSVEYYEQVLGFELEWSDGTFGSISRGARIRVPPTNYPWGAREVHVFDLDGHVLRFGSDAIEGEPMGEWLDEEGVRWQPQPDGSWTRVE